MGVWELLIFVLWVLLAIAAIYLVRRWMQQEAQKPKRPYNETGLQLLAERYARGEIDTEEYRERYRHLRGE